MKFITLESRLLRRKIILLMACFCTYSCYSQTIEVEHNSTTASPHLRLVEEGGDFSRIKMQNKDNPTKYWDVAARSDANSAIALFNFYYFNGTVGVDHLTITGEGKVGIGNTAPQATLDVDGYTRLGTESDSPQIKTKRINATTPSTGSTSLLPHGLSGYEKLLAVHLLIEDNLDGVFFYNHRSTIWNDDTHVAAATPLGNNRTYKMFIIYEN